MWPHNDAQAVHFLCIKRHGVRGQDPRSRTFAETSNSVKFLAFFLFSVCPGEWKAHVYNIRIYHSLSTPKPAVQTWSGATKR
jgi:hypothetical protein